MAGDPPLDQVVTRTFEAGVRGHAGDALLERRRVPCRTTTTTSCSSPTEQTGFGYFKNFGETRRQGVELGVNGHRRTFDFGAGYTWLDATYPQRRDRERRRATAPTTAGGAGLRGRRSTSRPAIASR